MKQQRINEIIGFLFLAVGVLIFISLATYDPADITAQWSVNGSSSCGLTIRTRRKNSNEPPSLCG